MTPALELPAIYLSTLPVLLPLLALLSLGVAAAIGWGRVVAGSDGGADVVERDASGLALGLALMGSGLFLAGALGALGHGVAGGLVVGGVGLFFGLRRPRSLSWPAVAGLGLALVFGGLLAYPLTGWDPAMYRLPTARAYLESGGLPFVPELRFPVGPQLGEMLFAGALGLAGDRLARGVVFLALLGTAALLFGWGRRLFGSAAGLVAAALWLGSPGAVLYGTDAYIDVLQALFTVAAVAAGERARTSGEARAALVAGLLAGAGAATRFTGLLVAVVVPLVLLVGAPRSKRMRACGWALAGVVVVAAPFYLRAALVTGNPLFPLMTGIFGPNDWDLGPLAGLYGSEGLVSFLPRLTVWPAAGPPIANPWLLPLLPVALLGAWREPRLRLPVGLGLGILLALGATAPDPRFGLPAVPLLALGIAGGLAPVVSRLAAPRWRLGLLALVLTAPGLLYTGYRLVRLGPVPRDEAAIARFLDREVHGHSLVRQLAKEPTRLTVYAYPGERLRFYSTHRWLGDTSGPYRWALVEDHFEDPAALARVLRSFGAERFVWIHSTRPQPAWLATGSAELGRVFADSAGIVYRVLPEAQPSVMAAATSARISGVE
ncbi:MAG: glycosyltransferase family 39 protein [Thermoanaerobaculia bacterium]|nr:glycosyltransferase family 39 protein [Thermoanaerobaculia bacterium]